MTDHADVAADRFTDPDYVRGMERLVHAVQDLSLARNLLEVQLIVRKSARELLGCDGATFVLRDDTQCYYADEDAIAPLWKGSRFPLESCISGWSMLNRAAAVIPDIYGDPRIPHAAYRPTFVKSLVMVPIRRKEPVGAIGAYWARQRLPSDREVSLLQALADSTSMAMDNVQIYAELEDRVRDRTAALETALDELHQQSVTDELTGLNNRRGFYLLAEQALRAAHRHGHNCLLAFLDVDGLKRVNDEYGHDAGDALISDIADLLRSTRNELDIIARIGGDEFCILSTAYAADPATLRAELAEAFQRANSGGDRCYHLSASIGIVRVDVTEATTVDELMAQADELMYAEKRATR